MPTHSGPDPIPSYPNRSKINYKKRDQALNSLCEGGADKGAAFYYARHLFASCTHKLYAPEHPAEPPPRPVCTRSPLCVGCPYPANGFLCWGKDGKCLRSEMRRFNAPDRQVAQEAKEE